MKIKNITYLLFTLLIGAMLQACVNDFGDCPEQAAPGIVKIRFNLNLGDMGRLTRADGVWNPTGDTSAGNSFDNAIKMNDASAKWLHVMLINSEGDLLHVNLDDGNYQLNPNEGGYDMTATLDFTDPEVRAKWQPGEYRVMVLANFRDKDKTIINKTNIDSLYSAINELKVDWYNNKNGDGNKKLVRNNGNIPNIPMWGMTTARFNLDGVSTQVFSIDLLRALAKVKIKFTQKLEEAGYAIKEAKVNQVYKKVYGMPAGWKDAKKTNDLSEYYDAAFHPESSTRLDNLIADISLPKVESDEDGSFVFYLPEWDAKKENNTTEVKITVTVTDDVGNEETQDLIISNASLGKEHYKNDIHNVNRNHLYQFTLDKDIMEGELSYKLECWNLQESAIGWNPPSWKFDWSGGDNEAEYGYVSFPSYNSDEKKYLIEDGTSFADYEFTLSEPKGAVWKAFLVEDGEEYPAGGRITSYTDNENQITITYTNAADTPHGFFFGVGNDDKNNQKAASTGVARDKPYNIKVGTRLKTVDFDGKNPKLLSGSDEEDPKSCIMELNNAGEYWRDVKNDVPKCYLVIKVAYDGKNFSDYLEINPSNTGVDSKKQHYKKYKFAGDATHIEIRYLPLFYKYKSYDDADGSRISLQNNAAFVIGKNNSESSDYFKYTWWDYPMGHKDVPDGSNPPLDPEEPETPPSE
ncbi:MAG: hypothetical protein K2G85_11225 [Muribaculaceae bacterium]|nr:hypothetical protein [Muribaculaceae bacterium]